MSYVDAYMALTEVVMKDYSLGEVVVVVVGVKKCRMQYGIELFEQVHCKVTFPGPV